MHIGKGNGEKWCWNLRTVACACRRFRTVQGFTRMCEDCSAFWDPHSHLLPLTRWDGGSFIFSSEIEKIFRSDCREGPLLNCWNEKKPPGGAPRGEFYFTLATNPPSPRQRIFMTLCVSFHLSRANETVIACLGRILHAAVWCYYLLLKHPEAVWLPFKLRRWFLMHKTQISPTCGELQSSIIEHAT